MQNLSGAAKRAGFFLSFGVVLALLGTGVCSASPITYNVAEIIGVGSVTGTIETDGTTGTLDAGNIIGWNLELNGNAASLNLTDLNSSVYVTGTDLTATATNLLFNFSGGDNGYALFQIVEFSGQNYFCDATSGVVCYQGASVAPEAFNSPSFQNVALTGNQIIGSATPLPAALPLFATGLGGLGLLGWRRKRKAQATWTKSQTEFGRAAREAVFSFACCGPLACARWVLAV
jgi:hypothetical protein